jgi:hypothetical protein
MRGWRAHTNYSLPMHPAVGLLVAWLLIAGCGTMPSESGTPTPVFGTTAEGDGNAVSISTSGDTILVDVRSQSGIGTATVNLVSGTPPANVVIRLHLSGLEAFRLSFEQTVVTAEVANNASHAVTQNIELPDGGTRPIASDSPLWLDIRLVSAQATPAIPLQQGYFEIRLPNGLLHDQRRSFTIRWIDFYR